MYLNSPTAILNSKKKIWVEPPDPHFWEGEMKVASSWNYVWLRLCLDISKNLEGSRLNDVIYHSTNTEQGNFPEFFRKVSEILLFRKSYIPNSIPSRNIHQTNTISQDKEPSARSELAVIQPLWPSVDLLIYKKILIRVLESSKILNQYICWIWSAEPDQP